MRSFYPCPVFPYDLRPAEAKSLSLLFILKELRALFHLLEASGEKIPVQMAGISLQLERFLRFSIGNPFTKTGGGLDKLCFYCETLLQASRVQSEVPLVILEEMRSSILKTKTSLVRLQKTPYLAVKSCAMLKELYALLKVSLRSFFNSLLPFLEESRTNENVLLYLIEHQKEWNQFLGDAAIEKLLQTFFPTGPFQLKAAICEGYTRRGFAAFYATKEPLVDVVVGLCKS